MFIFSVNRFSHWFGLVVLVRNLSVFYFTDFN